MRYDIFAHAGENHESVAEATEHALAGNNIIILGLVLVILVLIPLLLKSKMPRSNLPTIVLLAELFLVGVFAFSILPVLSIISLSIGFMLSFFFVMTGLSSKD